jgi:hypothetical protein
VAIVTRADRFGPGWGNSKATAALFLRLGPKVLLIDLSLKAAEEIKPVIDVEADF